MCPLSANPVCAVLIAILCIQVLHEPMLILAQKALPMLFASAFCANVCGETLVNLLTVFFESVLACVKHIKFG